MTFPHGCGDHHFLYLKKLFRRELTSTLFREDEERLVRAGWLRRNDEGKPEVTEVVAAYFINARRTMSTPTRPRSEEELMRERLFGSARPVARRRVRLAVS
ncbi:hypothetical protein [Solimonas marina]|uniref:Uncharacterized protein n=1 Tax=Solimonas marina TaxID=2714601 RepID=A0A970BAP7_9GAMM|nr:hypothetical protein [Solimonas marina]NKF24684.1 hypothetical protein [Solimonas marina]